MILLNMKVKGIDFLIIGCAWMTIYMSNLIDIGCEYLAFRAVTSLLAGSYVKLFICWIFIQNCPYSNWSWCSRTCRLLFSTSDSKSIGK